MGERIKEIRSKLGLTQQQFADRLQISRSNIATYESGNSNIGEAVIKLICREYDINETWLRTGEGEMFRPVSREVEIGQFVSKVVSGDNKFMKSLVSVMAKLSAEEWEMLADMADKLRQEMDDDK